MTYLERLKGVEPTIVQECGLGKVLRDEGQDKHDDIVAAIFATIHTTLPDGTIVDTGKLYPVPRLVELFEEEYGWSEFFFRRHRKGRCLACQNR